jgi:hypothetical protein
VITKITPDGLDLTNRIDQPLATVLKTHLGHIGPDRLKDLIGTLELLREERN